MDDKSKAFDYFHDELPADVFISKYALRDKDDALIEFTPDEMHRRIAKELARVESTKFKEPLPEDFIYGLLKDFQYIIPQGSILYGCGNHKPVSLSNCYVLGDTDHVEGWDSYGYIHYLDEQITAISKRRGGVGLNISCFRPAGHTTNNSSRTSTGIIGWMERFSNTIREVGQSGRRGASLQAISVHHPQVLDFATIKKNKTKVTGANISVLLTDEFLNAVDNDTEYEQRWPVNSKTPKVSRMVRARDVWEKIIECAWEMAEPGLIFWDRVLSESPADCYKENGFETIATNPCSELPLCPLDSCRLLLLNLFSFVERPFTKNAYFDYGKFSLYSGIAQRLMDDIVDLELESIDRIIAKIESDPEPEYIKDREKSVWIRIREKCLQGRRTGTGITALGDALAAIGVKYGSDESIEISGKIYRTLKHACYRSSVEMAKELGPFPIWDPELEKNNPYLLRIKQEDPSLYEDMQKYGRRNIALLTTSPAGSVSILAGPAPYFGTTSGIEPLFKVEPIVRRKKINHADKEAREDFVDQSGDKWQNYKVHHAKLQMWMDITGETDIKKSPYYGCCAEDIDWQQRVKLQAVCGLEVDHSISSTINLPENVLKEEVAKIYETAWKSQCVPGGNALYTSCGLKDVSKVVVGDMVISHKGRYAKVTKTIRNYYNGPIINIKATGAEQLRLTPDHPVLTVVLDNHHKRSWRKRTKSLMWKEAKDVAQGDYLVTPAQLETVVATHDINITDVIGDAVVDDERIYAGRTLPWGDDRTTLVKAAKSYSLPATIPINSDLVWFLGWYIAEGHISQKRYVNITLGMHERHIANRLVELSRSLFDLPAGLIEMVNSHGHRALRVRIGSRVLSDLLSYLSGKGSCNKHLPPWFNTLDHDLLKGLIDALWQGDKGVTISKRLAREMFWARRILNQNPYFKPNYGQGYFIAENNSTHATVGKHFDKWLCYRVRKVETIPFSGIVYNYEIEGDETYTVNGLVVHNCKGITVYRKNCRTGVLVDLDSAVAITKTNAPKRPKDLPCNIHFTKVKGVEYFVVVGLLAGDPYEVIAGINANKAISHKESGVIRKVKRGHYDLIVDDEVHCQNISKHVDDTEEALSRMVSTALRHGSSIAFVVDQLEKVHGELNSFSKACARVLKKYIKEGEKVSGSNCPSCNSDNLIREEGCVRCLECGFSKCS